MFTALFFAATAHGKWIWQSEGPITVNSEPFKMPSMEELAASVRTHKKVDPKHLLTQEEANDALRKTNCTEVVRKNPKSKMVAHGSDKCYNYHWWQSTPEGCPGSGWVKYDDFHVAEMKVGKAGISVDKNNKVGLVVSDVSLTVKPTAFTVQPKGLFTMTCNGVIKGVIKGAVNAIEAVIKLSAAGVPVIGEAAASPVDGVIVDLEHVLDGACAVLEDIIEGVLGLIVGVLKAVLGVALPAVLGGLLNVILGVVGVVLPQEAETALLGGAGQLAEEGWPTPAPAMLPPGWTRLALE